MNNKLLIVDDDQDIRVTLRGFFEENYEVLEAATGEEALRLIQEMHPRLMLLDLNMPGMSGLDVLKAAREAAVAMTIIMLTGEHDVELAKRALDLGASEYVTKPFDWARLKDRVERTMGSSLIDAIKQRWLPWRVVVPQFKTKKIRTEIMGVK